GVERRHADAHLGALHRVFERELEAVAQVGTAEHIASAATALAAGTKDVAEHVAEDIGEARATGSAARGIETARARGGRRIDAGVPELIVGRALLRVRKDFVRLFYFLELRFGVFLVVRIAIG